MFHVKCFVYSKKQVIVDDYKFNCAEREKYTLEEKDALGKLFEKYML